MAEYNFPFRNSSVYNKPGNDWSKTSYASDHVCRPVIIDAEGRKRPIVSYGPQQSTDFYVARTETVVTERVPSPFASEYKHSPYRSPDPQEGYGVVEERWQKPSSPVYSRPPKVDEFLNKVQNEASKPRFGPLGTANWHHTTKPSGFAGDSGGYNSEYSDFNNHDWQKPSGNHIDNHDDYFSKQDSAMEPSMVTNGGWGRPRHATYSKPTNDIITTAAYFKEPVKHSHTDTPHFQYTEPAYTETNDSRGSTPIEPTMITRGGWVRPSPATWASPPDSNLSKPTSDINTALGILREDAKPSFSPAQNSRNTEPGFTETIDSTEAARRYKFKFPSRPYKKEDNYTTTIDSREAARKYHGATI